MSINSSEEIDVRPIKHFAVLVDSEYTGIVSFPESNDPRMQRLLEGLSQNPVIVSQNQEENSTPNSIKKYAVTVNAEEFGKIYWPNIDSEQAVIAGLDSNPTILPVNKSQVRGVPIGWIWDGSNFNRP